MIVVHASRYMEGAMEALQSLHQGAEVLARYQRVMNIRTASGRLIGIQVQGTPLSPFGIEVQTDGAIEWPAAGTSCVLQGRHLLCGSLLVDLGYMRLADKPLFRAVENASWVEHCAALLQPYAQRSWIPVVAASHEGQSSQQSLSNTLRQLSKLLNSESHGSGMDVTDVTRLIGWGPGSTPSGDDFLIGFFGAWCRLSPSAPAPVALLEALAARASLQTTPLAAEFYVHLARGRLSEPIDHVLHAIGMEDSEYVRRAADTLADFGASSGFDTLAGIWWYLQST